MPTPLDVYLGLPLAPERQAAIDGVRAAGCEEENSEFWDHVNLVQDICASSKHDPIAVAKALLLIDPYISPDGEYGRMAIFDRDLAGLVRTIAGLLK
jgi:hypothetical protein